MRHLGISAVICLVSVLVLGCQKNGIPAAQSPATLREIQLAPDLLVREVKRDVFVVTHSFPWAADSLLVKVSKNEFVFVDTPYTREATEAVLGWLRKTFGEVRVVEINTGYHVDNLGGNAALLTAEIPVYGSSLTAQLLQEKGESTRAKLLEWLAGPENTAYLEAHKTMQYLPPNNLFDADSGLVLTFDDESVEAFFPGPSHAADNIVVYFKNRQILFGGCMVKAWDADNLGFTGDANLDAWPEAVKRVSAKYSDAEIVVPGHGAVGDGRLFEHTLSLLAASAAPPLTSISH
jgi:glyoxylase-like metal-dependent hydrolase (beta-lactamase superfamily II)